MVQQLCIGDKTKWKSQTMPRSSMVNQALIRPVHKRPTLNNIFLKVNNAEYLSLIDASSGYHNLKLD